MVLHEIKPSAARRAALHVGARACGGFKLAPGLSGSPRQTWGVETTARASQPSLRGSARLRSQRIALNGQPERVGRQHGRPRRRAPRGWLATSRLGSRHAELTAGRRRRRRRLRVQQRLRRSLRRRGTLRRRCRLQGRSRLRRYGGLRARGGRRRCGARGRRRRSRLRRRGGLCGVGRLRLRRPDGRVLFLTRERLVGLEHVGAQDQRQLLR